MDAHYLQESKQSRILAIDITFPALALITVFLRLYTRIFVIHNAASEDYSIVLAIVSFSSMYGAECSFSPCF
jgi:multisubunit Na+/H+ antiporter MnhF subunit